MAHVLESRQLYFFCCSEVVFIQDYPSGRIWHKVFFIVGIREGEVTYESRLVRYWSLLVIGSLGAMWTILVIVKSPGTYARWPCRSQIHLTWWSSAIWNYACHYCHSEVFSLKSLNYPKPRVLKRKSYFLRHIKLLNMERVWYKRRKHL